MRIAAALTLAALALAGCGGASSGDNGKALQKQEAARAAELGKISGWERAFQPDVAVAAANQFGFHPKPYAKVTQLAQEYRSDGGPVMISSSFAKQPNRVGFTAAGATADTIDRVAFDLAITDAKGAPDARTRLADLVRDYLFQSKIDAKPVHAAIVKGEPAKGDLAGTPWQIVRTPKDGAEHLTVTFTRTGASAPANS